MKTIHPGQTDIFAELESIDRQERTAGIRGFTPSGEYTPDELDDALVAWADRHGSLGCMPRSHMWHNGLSGACGGYGSHMPREMTADLRCGAHIKQECSCAGDLVYRIYCHECCWWTGIYESREAAVLAQLDHCWPGWRELDPLPHRGPVPAGYPERWKQGGAPVITQRTAPSTRSVLGFSPFGGFDIAAVTAGRT